MEGKGTCACQLSAQKIRPRGQNTGWAFAHPDHGVCGWRYLNLKGDFIVSHKFSIGQAVVLVPRVLQPAAPGEYEVRQLMPARDRDPGDPSYRIKSADEKHERVVVESELTPVARAGLAH
jgi:hypothetical protein